VRLASVPLLVAFAGLCGCVGVNQDFFAAHMHALVRPGMPTADAVAALQGRGFSCDSRVAAPAISCTKERQSLLPSTCIERVNLLVATSTVTGIEVPQVMCAGL